jgi:hypothetical protein
MQTYFDDCELLYCPVCQQPTDSLKQYRVIRSIVAIPIDVDFTSVVHQSCPRCMRAFLWKRCLINGLTTWIVGYAVLLPYTLAFTVATMRKGHSWPVLHGVTPEMHLNRTWRHEPTRGDKWLAVFSAFLCLFPGVGVLYCWFVLWKTHWCSGWVHKTAEIAAFVAYFATICFVSFLMERGWQ